MKAAIEVSGKKYTLQHPGNRAWLTLKQEVFKVSSDQMDVVKLLDYCFENVVFPENGDKLSLDKVPLNELEQVWQVVLPTFLMGELEPGFTWGESK